MRRAEQAEPGQDTDVALHDARKAAKRPRSPGEAGDAGPGQRPRRFARPLQQVQSVLGDHQDAVIARQAALELGTEAQLAGEDALPYRLLEAHESRRAEELRARARSTWRRASRRRYRAWLR